MKCPKCESSSCRKNGRKSGKQNYLCKDCGRQFLEPLNLPQPDVNTPGAGVNGGKRHEDLNGHALHEILTIQEAANNHLALTNNKTPSGISILLLDAENLKLNVEIEIFLAGVCQHNLQVKIAFANWKNPTIGKHDTELYERGYQLVHVPGGKDSADAKMIALGACLLQQYSTVKEVFVCSGDRILAHLCNQLQSQGLTVYWVRRQAQSLKVENCNNGEVTYYSLAVGTMIPSVEAFVQKIEDIIKAEQKSISARLSSLTTVATLFQEKRSLIQNDEVAPIKVIETDETKNNQIITPEPSQINSREELEKALLQIIHLFKVQSPQTQLSVSKLGTELRKVTGQTPNSIIKKLKLGSNFTKFLNSCSTFKLTKTNEQYEITVR